MEHDPLEVVEYNYHLFVLAGYSFVIAVIVSVLHMRLIEHIGLWIVGVAFFGAVLSKIRKGLEPRPKFDV
jgi:hypothetical protein